jgi:mono/diheme cytochrome c family protein
MMARVEAGVVAPAALALALAACAAAAGPVPGRTVPATPASPPTWPSPTVSVGAALFRNKGCASCHRHDAVPGATGGNGPAAPDLSAYAGTTAFVARWLADPAAVRPGTKMPKLPLAERDIRALAEFVAGR